MSPERLPAFRQDLLRWYEANKRDLPWRRTRDPYRIWLSEVMLQQTRVATALPYYERFLQRFPDVASLAAAPDDDLLAAWAGLGYYYRARNLRQAAQEIVSRGGFPQTFDELLQLRGVGEYTAAAVSSIAFDQPHAVVDGNVLRVVSRVENDARDIASQSTKRAFQAMADQWLDHSSPAAWNQAVMELGATICLPKKPQCLVCPVREWCEARRQGRQDELPVKQRKMNWVEAERTLLFCRRCDEILLHQRPPESRLMPGFYELPEPEHVPHATIGAKLAQFFHTITHHKYTFVVYDSIVGDVLGETQWIPLKRVAELPMSTVAKKALRLVLG